MLSEELKAEWYVAFIYYLKSWDGALVSSSYSYGDYLGKVCLKVGKFRLIRTIISSIFVVLRTESRAFILNYILVLCLCIDLGSC